MISISLLISLGKVTCIYFFLHHENSTSFFFSSSDIDLDQDGYLDQKEIQKACKDTGYSDNYDEIRATLKDVSTNASGKIDVEEFIEVIIREGNL